MLKVLTFTMIVLNPTKRSLNPLKKKSASQFQKPKKT